MNKVLMISYFAPPINSPASIRVGKFANYLPEFGWKATILTVKELSYYKKEPRLFPNVATDDIVRTESIDPMRLLQLLKNRKKKRDLVTKLHQNGEGLTNKIKELFPIDDKIGWIPFCIVKAGKIIKQDKYDAIYCTIGGTNSHAIAAYRISKKYAIPFVMDIRDPWADHMFSTRTWYNKILNNYWEKKVFLHAKKLICVTEGMKKKILDKYNFPDSKIDVIYNGFDDFVEYQYKKTTKEIIFTFAGNMYKDILPGKLYDLLLEIERDYWQDFKLKLRFIGNYRSRFYSLLEKFNSKKADNIIVEVLPFMPKASLHRYLHQSDALMIFLPNRDGAEQIITTKFFDYLPYKKPIIAFCTRNGELAELIISNKLGFVIDHSDSKEKLLEIFELYRNGDLEKIRAKDDFISSHSRRQKTKKLATLLDIITQTGD
jgi:glycosyltransferase involved in cell wall biosynthesis